MFRFDFGYNIILVSYFDKINFLSNSLVSINTTDYIDVFWLVDDGGFLLLLPHIMKLHSFWDKYLLRINVIIDSDHLSTEILQIKSLISDMR